MFTRKLTVKRRGKTYTYYVAQSSKRVGGKVVSTYHGMEKGWLRRQMEPEYPGRYGVQKMEEREAKFREEKKASEEASTPVSTEPHSQT